MATFSVDYIVNREIQLKITEEQKWDTLEAKVYNLPFKLKVQTLMENNKAMDERTKEDRDQMEKEAKLEIERNFPSYLDEY